MTVVCQCNLPFFNAEFYRYKLPTDLFQLHVLEPPFVERNPNLTFQESLPLGRRRGQLTANLLQRQLVRLALVQVGDGRFVDLKS
jgi:hypothetical protein